MPVYTPSELRKFRKAVSILKKRGLLTGTYDRSGLPIDARSAYPSGLVKGKKLSTLVKKFDDVVSGKVVPLKASPQKLKQFRKAGFRTGSGRIFVDVSATESAKLHKGEIVKTSRLGIETVHIPVPYHNLEQYLRDIQKDHKRINRMKRNNENFGFRFYGNNSIMAYSDIGDAIDDFTKYDAVIDADTASEQSEVYAHLVIIKIKKRGEAQWESEQANRKRATSKEYQAKRAKRFRARIKNMPKWKQDKIKRGIADRMKAYRLRLKKDKKATKKYKKDARARAKKSHATYVAKKKVTKKRSKKK